MGFINLAERTVHAKLVYYGIGSGGKTTSLQAVHGIMCPSNEVKLVSINTEDDATLLFDFLPIDMGEVEGFKIGIQGFTVPGQPKYRRMRKYVLQGADAVVLVVDSQRSRLEENIEALESLIENLKSNGLDPKTLPIFVQYNKRDLEDIMTEAEMDPHFLFRDDIKSFPTVATESQGVYETFVHCAGVLVERKIRQYNLGKGTVNPEEVAESARTKLWSIFDEYRNLQEEREKKRTLRLTVRDPSDVEGGAEVDPDIGDSVQDEFDTEGETSSHSDDLVLGTPTMSLELDSTPRPLEFGREVFSDTDLDINFSGIQPSSTAAEIEQYEDGEEGLLDQALQSNLDLAEAYGQLDQYCAGLKRKNDELIKVTQNSVHDLRKPLTAIRLMLKSGIQGYLGELNGNLKPGLENALMACDLMDRLVEDLTDSMKFDTEFKMNFEDVDMSLMVGDVLHALRYLIDEKDVRVHVEPLPVIRADSWALTKAFMNLLGNAIQYASPDHQPRLHVHYEDAGDYHCFHVADNGIGIPEGQHEKLFLRFERGSNVEGVSGTGLGLHIAKETVMGHGGFIKLDSKLGQGSTFRVHVLKDPVVVPQTDIVEALPSGGLA